MRKLQVLILIAIGALALLALTVLIVETAKHSDRNVEYNKFHKHLPTK